MTAVHPLATIPVHTSEGLSLAVEAHPCAGDGPVVLILHGLFSHTGWYRGLAGHLIEVGAAVYLMDRRGSGRSQGLRGHMPSWQALVDDVLRVCREIRILHPGRPIHALGISLGATISLATSILHPDLFASQILLSPGLASIFRLPLHRRLRLAERSLFRPTRLYDLPFSVATLTHHPDWQRALAEDPLSTRQVTARFLVATFRMQQFVLAAMSRCKVPVFALLAERDRLVDNQVTLAALRRIRDVRVRVEIFAEASHILPASVPGAELASRFSSWWKSDLTAGTGGMDVVPVVPFPRESLALAMPPTFSLQPDG